MNIGSCTRTRKLNLVDTADRRCNVALEGVFFNVRDLALESNGNYHRLLSVPTTTNRGCTFELAQPGDILLIPEGSVFEMVKSKGLVSLPTVKHYMVTVPTIVLSKQPELCYHSHTMLSCA
jgi:hypothetical protein